MALGGVRRQQERQGDDNRWPDQSDGNQGPGYIYCKRVSVLANHDSRLDQYPSLPQSNGRWRTPYSTPLSLLSIVLPAPSPLGHCLSLTTKERDLATRALPGKHEPHGGARTKAIVHKSAPEESGDERFGSFDDLNQACGAG